MATDKGKQLLSATSRKGHHHGIRKVVLACTGSVVTSVNFPWLRETYGREGARVTHAVGHVGSGKGQSLGDSNEPEGALNKPWHPTLIWDPLNINGKKLSRSSLVPELNAINTCGVQNTVTGTVYCHDLTELTKEAIFDSFWNLWHLISHHGARLEDPKEPDKKAMHSVLFEPDDVPNKPQFLAGMLSIEGNCFPSVSLLSELNSIGICCGIGRLSMVENQLPSGTVQATACLELKPIQFEVPYVGVSFDPLASPGGTAGFSEFGFAESAYGGMFFDPFWESALLINGKAIQFHAKTAYAGMRFDQFQKSVPPSVTFLAAGSVSFSPSSSKAPSTSCMWVGGLIRF